MSFFRLGALILAMTALLAFTSSAVAKGGGGGGGGGGATCAQIVDFTVTTNADNTLTTSYTVNNGCVDERMSAAALDSKNLTTGFTGRAVNMLPYGLSTYTSTSSPATPGTSFTFTLTVYAPNGKIADTRTINVTVPAEVAPAA